MLMRVAPSPPLLAWVLSWWEGNQLALALDATTLGQRFVVLVVSVLYRGCAIPVAWTVIPAGEKHGWRPEWLRMLRQVRAAGVADRLARTGFEGGGGVVDRGREHAQNADALAR